MAFKLPSDIFRKQKVLIPQDPSLPSFVFSNVHKGEEIGRGAFASVHIVKYKGRTYVVKTLHVDEWNDVGKQFIKEAKLLHMLKSEFVIGFKMYVTVLYLLCWSMLVLTFQHLEHPPVISVHH